LTPLVTLPVFAKTAEGRKIPLEVGIADSVKMVKRQIEEKTGIPVDQQGLSYKEKRLQDDHTVQSCNITKGAVLEIVPASNDINVMARTLEGKKIPLKVSLDDTVSRVKQKIEEKEGISMEKQDLAYRGKRIENDQTVGKIGIEAGSVLDFVALAEKKLIKIADEKDRIKQTENQILGEFEREWKLKRRNKLKPGGEEAEMSQRGMTLDMLKKIEEQEKKEADEEAEREERLQERWLDQEKEDEKFKKVQEEQELKKKEEDELRFAKLEEMRKEKLAMMEKKKAERQQKEEKARLEFEKKLVEEKKEKEKKEKERREQLEEKKKRDDAKRKEKKEAKEKQEAELQKV
jgi:hypothetical protein